MDQPRIAVEVEYDRLVQGKERVEVALPQSMGMLARRSSRRAGCVGFSLMLIAPVRWARRHWPLPLLTVPCPSERYYRACGRTHRTLLLGLYALVALTAERLVACHALPVRTAAWYAKRTPNFSDALAWARRCCWIEAGFPRR
ncbi:MAG: hypothetical protein WC383_11575 [Gammaproteobacteria bacterium]